MFDRRAHQLTERIDTKTEMAPRSEYKKTIKSRIRDFFLGQQDPVAEPTEDSTSSDSYVDCESEPTAPSGDVTVEPALLEQQRLVKELVNAVVIRAAREAKVPPSDEMQQQLYASLWAEIKDKNINIKQKRVKSLEKSIFKDIMKLLKFEPQLVIIALGVAQPYQNVVISVFKDRLLRKKRSLLSRLFSWCGKTPDDGDQTEKISQTVLKEFKEELSPLTEEKSEIPHDSSSSSNLDKKKLKGLDAEVLCDVCTGTRLKAVKSCLVCLTSYCQTHLEPHLTATSLKRHLLIDAVENLESRMCRKHNKHLELFCKTDQTCVCVLCSVLEHKNHECVPLKEACKGKKAVLEKTEAEIQQMIQKRQLSIQEITELVKMSKDAPDRQKAEGVQDLTALTESVERCLKELTKEIKNQQAECLIKELEQEISELMERSSEVEQLLRSEDHIHLLQGFSSLKAALQSKDWTEVRVHPPLYGETVVRAVEALETLRKLMKKEQLEAELQRVQQEETQQEETQQEETQLEETQQEETQLEETQLEETQLEETQQEETQLEETQLEETQQEETQQEETLRKDLKKKQREAVELKRVQQEETHRNLMKKKQLEAAELWRVQQHAVDVTLDPHTANPWLVLSDDEKQVYDSDVEKNLPDNPERFSECVIVLGEQSFSSGRFYFEVQVKGKTDWDVGVARETINRKGEITASPEDGFWTVGLRNRNNYEANTNNSPSVPLHLHPGPEKVGVFVDYEEGLVSFYDVGAAALIYSFTGCSFTHKLHPFFTPCPNDEGKNSAPLIICPVNRTKSYVPADEDSS